MWNLFFFPHFLSRATICCNILLLKQLAVASQQLHHYSSFECQRAALVFAPHVCLPFILVKSSICIDLDSPPSPWPLPTQSLFTLRLPLVSPRKSADHSTWLILNVSCKEMCLFINTELVLPVYCSHGSGGLLNKQLLCLPA